MITLCDTGPLVAYFARRDRHHVWAREFMKTVAALVTCEAVIAEAAYFLREDGVGVEPLFDFIGTGALRIEFTLGSQWPRVRTLMKRYPAMDLADACLVVMSERHARSRVVTFDRKDFSVYRRNDRQVIDFVAPP